MTKTCERDLAQMSQNRWLKPHEAQLRRKQQKVKQVSLARIVERGVRYQYCAPQKAGIDIGRHQT